MIFAKWTGLAFATGAGLLIGREGPFVHLSAGIANNLSRIKIFNRIHQKSTFRK